MGFDRSQATTNANSKCLRIERVVSDRDRPATERMALIAAIVEEYETGVPEWARETSPGPEYRDAPRRHEWPCAHFYTGMAQYDPNRPCTCRTAPEPALAEPPC